MIAVDTLRSQISSNLQRKSEQSRLLMSYIVPDQRLMGGLEHAKSFPACEMCIRTQILWYRSELGVGEDWDVE